MAIGHSHIVRQKTNTQISGIFDEKVVSSEDEKSTVKNPNDSLQQGDFVTFFPSDRICSFHSNKNTGRIGSGQRLFECDTIEVVKGDNSPLAFDEDIEVTLNSASKLKLQVISALSLPTDTEIIIDAKGLVNGKKAVKGTGVYFGTQSTVKAPVDYLIPKVERGIGTVHCVIQYDTIKNCYQIKDLGNGCGTFIKIVGKIPLKSGHMIFFGEIHFLITVKEGELVIKFMGGPKTNTQL
jgi:hypothetical protein